MPPGGTDPAKLQPQSQDEASELAGQLASGTIQAGPPASVSEDTGRPVLAASLGQPAIRRQVACLFAIAFFIPLAFALYTHHAWEDWYITYRASKNLALGNGLVFSPGQRVHSFTSPLGTLLPAVFSWLTGSDDVTLWLFRLLNCGLLALSSIGLWSIARHLRFNNWATACLLGMFLLESKIVDFSINGMETGLMMVFLTVLLCAMNLPMKRRVLVLAVACGGLMWSRPDSFVYIGGLLLGCFLFNPWTKRSQMLLQLAGAAALAGVLYVPWLAWAQWYYGTFIPHTIVAKSLAKMHYQGAPIALLIDLAVFPLESVFDQTIFDKLLLPPEAIEGGGWPGILAWVSRIPAWVTAFAWVLPFLRPATRAVSFGLMVACLYLTFCVPVQYPWYLPSAALLSIVVLALLLQDALQRSLLRAWIWRTTVVLSLTCGMGLLLATAYEMRIRQQVIEDGHRKQIGLWLKEHAVSSTDRVFVECLGYVGFYSNLKMYDYPGLSSPEVVHARRVLHSDSFAKLISYLQPEWAVLRPFEMQKIQREDPSLLQSIYTPVGISDAASELAEHRFLPGRPYFQYDQTFIIFKRGDWPGRNLGPENRVRSGIPAARPPSP
jgi:hypothetical protein